MEIKIIISRLRSSVCFVYDYTSNEFVCVAWSLHPYTDLSMQAANAREVWMEMDIPDHVIPGRYEWAEVCKIQ